MIVIIRKRTLSFDAIAIPAFCAHIVIDDTDYGKKECFLGEKSGSRGFLAPSPHNTLHAGPHRAFHLEW